jgi:hypothetical protein
LFLRDRAAVVTVITQAGRNIKSNLRMIGKVAKMPARRRNQLAGAISF